MSKLEVAQRILDEVVAIRKDSGVRSQESEERNQKSEGSRQG
jgi:hypothetical protein